ncbi:hypothetical protein GCM10009527_056250 [Actinomadura nitritigenes]
MAHELVEVDPDRVHLTAGISQFGMQRDERSVHRPLLANRSLNRLYDEGATRETGSRRRLVELFVLLVADADSQFPISPPPSTELRSALQRLRPVAASFGCRHAPPLLAFERPRSVPRPASVIFRAEVIHNR